MPRDIGCHRPPPSSHPRHLLLLPGCLFLLDILLLMQSSPGAGAVEEGGFQRAQCPRPEDIHPCTCILIPKQVEDLDGDLDEERRFARSAVLHESIPNVNLKSDSIPQSQPTSFPSSSASASLPSSLSGEEAESPAATTTTESLPSDPEITTTASLIDVDLSTLSPRFRATVNSLLSSTPHSRPLATTSDEVDYLSTLSPLANEDSNVRYEPTVDTTPPPMEWLKMMTLSSRSVFSTPTLIKSTTNPPEQETTRTTSMHESPSTTQQSSTTKVESPTTATPAATTSSTASPTTSSSTPSSSHSPLPLSSPPPSALPLAQAAAGAAVTPPSSPSPSPSTSSSPPEPVLMTEPTPATTSIPPTSEKRIMRPVGEKDIPVPAAGSADEPTDHWSLWESMLVCRNIRSSRVIAETLKSMRGYHFNFVVLDNVKLPQPFPFSLFQRFSFDFLELLNLSSLQFVDNFDDKGREYYYGRSQRGSDSRSSKGGDSSMTAAASSTSTSWSPASHAARKQRRRK